MRRFVITFMIIGGIMLSISNIPKAFGGSAVSMASRLEREALPKDFNGWQKWYQDDQNYLKLTLGVRRSAEIRELRNAMMELQRRPDARVASKDVRIYAPTTSGQLQMLASAINARSSGRSNHAWRNLYGNFLKPEQQGNHPSTAEAKEILETLPVNGSLLQGLEVYLLPYSMGDTGGIGGNGYAFIAATPEGMVLIPDHLRVTLTHEVGHHVHLKMMDRGSETGRRRWNEYLKIRGIPWRDTGRAMTKAWSLSSEEVFAEDFRVWVSSPTQHYFGDLAYPNPSNRTGMRLRSFFLSLSEYPEAKAENPWVATDAEEMLPYSLWMMVFGGIVVVIAIKKRPCGRKSIFTSSYL